MARTMYPVGSSNEIEPLFDPFDNQQEWLIIFDSQEARKPLFDLFMLHYCPAALNR